VHKTPLWWLDSEKGYVQIIQPQSRRRQLSIDFCKRFSIIGRGQAISSVIDQREAGVRQSTPTTKNSIAPRARVSLCPHPFTLAPALQVQVSASPQAIRCRHPFHLHRNRSTQREGECPNQKLDRSSRDRVSVWWCAVSNGLRHLRRGRHQNAISPQFTAFFTSSLILASSAAVNSFGAKPIGPRAPSSRFALSLKPNVRLDLL
jgi:hypothetical protein